jgi:hypothetical protein
MLMVDGVHNVQDWSGMCAMANWATTLNLLPEYDEARAGNITIQALAAVVAERLGKLKWPAQFESDQEELADEFDCLSQDPDANVSDFDDVLERLYDVADARIDNSPWPYRKLCWVKTF